jgi:hypothetical protein
LAKFYRSLSKWEQFCYVNYHKCVKLGGEMEDVMVADRACEDFWGLAGLGGDVVDGTAFGAPLVAVVEGGIGM